MKSIALSLLCFAMLFGADIKNQNNIDKSGFRDSSTLLDENKVKVADINYTAEPAGMAVRFDRAFENAPPLIPHDLEGLLPITTELNMCTTCHLPEFAKDAGSTPIPPSHFINLRTGEDLKGKLDDTRYNCVQCHVPQSNAKPLIANEFKPVFRDKALKTKSNFLDVLNEGIE